MKKLKGWRRLTLQIAILSVSMIALSFFTESQLWYDYFNYLKPKGECGHINCGHGFDKEIIYNKHFHWNYRGFVYVFTGFVYFIMSIVRIVTSHKEGDFKNN